MSTDKPMSENEHLDIELTQIIHAIGDNAKATLPIIGLLPSEATEKIHEWAKKYYADAKSTEIASLRAEVEDWRETQRSVMSETCPTDEKHCTCVPMLKKENASLRKQLEETASEAKSKLEERDMSLASLMVGICNNTGQYAMPNEGEDALQWLTRVSNETKLQRDTLKKQLEATQADKAEFRCRVLELIEELVDTRGRLEEARGLVVAASKSLEPFANEGHKTMDYDQLESACDDAENTLKLIKEWRERA